MESVWTSETSVCFFETTQCYNPEGCNVHNWSIKWGTKFHTHTKRQTYSFVYFNVLATSNTSRRLSTCRPHEPPLPGVQLTLEHKPIGHKHKNHHTFLAGPVHFSLSICTALLLGSLIAEAMWKKVMWKKVMWKKTNRVENLRGVWHLTEISSTILIKYSKGQQKQPRCYLCMKLKVHLRTLKCFLFKNLIVDDKTRPQIDTTRSD
jgi:hypothetical protein